MGSPKVLTTENSRTVLTLEKECQAEKNTQFIGASIATLSALSMGMCLAWSSPAIPMLKSRDHFYPTKVTDEQGSWIGSLITLGACAGAIPAGLIASSLGRKRTLQLLSVPLFLSWIMIAFSGCIYGLYAARFLAGLAVGAISVAAPMYVAELAHKSIRGTLGTFFQVQITVGLLLEYILGGALQNYKSLALASSLLPVVFLVSFTLMPETPVHLYASGRVEEARRALIFFRGDDYCVDEELMRIADDIKEASVNKAKVSDLINCRTTFKALIISLGLMVFQQLSGINVVLFYAGNIFSETGSSLSPDASAILIGLVQVVATLISAILIDRAGRKILLLISAFVMSVCLLTLGVYFHLKQYRDLSSFSAVPLASVAVFIVVFSIGFGPIPWLMMGEIFAPKMRSAASSLSVFVNWTLAFIVTKQFDDMRRLMGIGATFALFGVVCAVGAVFVAALVPETKGKTIDEVQNVLLGNECTKCNGTCEKIAPV